jgi:hypothetical protein
VIEFDTDFHILTDDVQQLLKQNLTSLSLLDVTSKAVNATNNRANFMYDGSSRSVIYPDISSATVNNDTFSFSIKSTMKLKEGLVSKAKTYSVDVSVPDVAINYTKSYSLDEGKFTISDCVYGLDESTVKITISGSPSSTDQQTIKETVMGNLLVQVKDKLKSIPQWLDTIVVDENLSNVYVVNPYPYKYYNYSIDIDTNTVMLGLAENDTVLVNGLSGSIHAHEDTVCP